MQKPEFQARLKAVGWTLAGLSRRFGMCESSLYRWVEVPGYAVAYLELLEGVSKALKVVTQKEDTP